MAEQFIKRKAQSVTEDVSENTWSEGATDTLGTGNNDSTINLSHGDVGQYVHDVVVSVPGGVGAITVTFYDGAAATTPISTAQYLASQPANGFKINKSLTSGTLGIRIAGWTSGSTGAYINVRYSY